MQTETATRQSTIDLQPAAAQPLATVQPPPAQTAQVLTPARLIELAMAQNSLDLDRLERLLKMEAEWKAARAKEAFDEDFARFTKLGLVVPKTKHVQQRGKEGKPGPQYWQSEFHVVAGLLKPALGECGFGVSFDVEFQRDNGGGPWCQVKCTLTHQLGYSQSVTLGGPPDDSGAKNPLQEMQSSATFLMRHALLAITGTAQEGHDNDGRGQRGYREDADESNSAVPAGELDKLRATGRDKALEGMAALTAWWGALTKRQRDDLSPDFKTWRTGAQAVDSRKGAARG